jgi:hypothetical protein
MAKVVPGKGVGDYSVGTVKKMIEQVGYKMVILRSRSEPAILAPKEAVRRESDFEVFLGEAPTADHQPNRLVEENVMENAQGQLRGTTDAWSGHGGRA